MDLEATYCRSRFAKIVNQQEDMVWQPQINASTAGSVKYISGRPDGEVLLWQKVPTYIECKAALGAVFLGDPDNQDNTTGWHMRQRNWWRNIAKKVDYPYRILLWVYPERAPSTRIMQERSYVYLVPPEAWLELEEKVAPRKTIALLPELERETAYRQFALAKVWEAYRTTWTQIISDIRSIQCN